MWRPLWPPCGPQPPAVRAGTRPAPTRPAPTQCTSFNLDDAHLLVRNYDSPIVHRSATIARSTTRSRKSSQLRIKSPANKTFLHDFVMRRQTCEMRNDSYYGGARTRNVFEVTMRRSLLIWFGTVAAAEGGPLGSMKARATAVVTSAMLRTCAVRFMVLLNETLTLFWKAEFASQFRSHRTQQRSQHSFVRPQQRKQFSMKFVQARFHTAWVIKRHQVFQPLRRDLLR